VIKACLLLRDLAIHVANPYATCSVLLAKKTWETSVQFHWSNAEKFSAWRIIKEINVVGEG